MTRISVLVFSMLAAVPAIGLAAEASQTPEKTQAQPLSVLMYVLPNCGYCDKARQYFSAKAIRVEERDISSSESHHAQFKAAGGQGTPLVIIGAQKIHGFDQAALDTALANAQAKK
jgi:glutaredoxin